MGVIVRGECRCCHRTRALEPDGDRKDLCADCGHCCDCYRLRRLDMMEPYGKCAACLGLMDREPQPGDPPGPVQLWAVMVLLLTLLTVAYGIPMLLAWLFFAMR